MGKPLRSLLTAVMLLAAYGMMMLSAMACLPQLLAVLGIPGAIALVNLGLLALFCGTHLRFCPGGAIAWWTVPAAWALCLPTLFLMSRWGVSNFSQLPTLFVFRFTTAVPLSASTLLALGTALVHKTGLSRRKKEEDPLGKPQL